VTSLARVIGVAPALVAAACASTPALLHDTPRVADKLPIAPYAADEVCGDLARGDRLDYRYQASEPVDFDLRYRQGGAVVSPIVRERSTRDSGIFEAGIAGHYCAHWQAGPAGTLLDYRIEIRGPATTPQSSS
jgi:hypothetical protein